VKPDILSELPPVPEACRGAEAFELIHVFEHFYKWDAEALLGQFFDLLRPGGELVIECPNILSAIETLGGRNGKPVDQWGMWVLYGDPGRRNPFFGHRWGWTPDTLGDALSLAGFETIRTERPKHHVPERDFRLVGVK
jgi:SAM-dependent methyltransferase